MHKHNKHSVAEDVFIAKGAVMTGEVTIGDSSSVWYQAVVRSDGTIKIGHHTNIQDQVIIHSDKGESLLIGDYVTVGHRAILHNRSVGTNSLIGMGAILLDGAVIGDNCIIGAGSLVTQGTVIPSGEVWLGSPARYRRKIRTEEIEENKQAALNYCELAKEILNS